MQTARIRKINSLIKDQLGQIIFDECDWTHLAVVSITKVDTSPDLAQSKILVSIFADKDKQQEYFNRLRRAVKHLRFVLAQKIELRKIPFLKFELDDSIAVGVRVTQLLEQA